MRSRKKAKGPKANEMRGTQLNNVSKYSVECKLDKLSLQANVQHMLGDWGMAYPSDVDVDVDVDMDEGVGNAYYSIPIFTYYATLNDSAGFKLFW